MKATKTKLLLYCFVLHFRSISSRRKVRRKPVGARGWSTQSQALRLKMRRPGNEVTPSVVPLRWGALSSDETHHIHSAISALTLCDGRTRPSGQGGREEAHCILLLPSQKSKLGWTIGWTIEWTTALLFFYHHSRPIFCGGQWHRFHVPASAYLASQAVHQAEQQGLLLVLLRCAEQEVHVVSKLLPPGQRTNGHNHSKTHLSRKLDPQSIHSTSK